VWLFSSLNVIAETETAESIYLLLYFEYLYLTAVTEGDTLLHYRTPHYSNIGYGRIQDDYYCYECETIASAIGGDTCRRPIAATTAATTTMDTRNSHCVFFIRFLLFDTIKATPKFHSQFPYYKNSFLHIIIIVVVIVVVVETFRLFVVWW
jgi:hypothetical protein